MVLELAMEVVNRSKGLKHKSTASSVGETLEGLFTLTITPLNEDFQISTKWKARKKNKPKTRKFHKLADDFIYAIERECSNAHLAQTVKINGFTEMKTLDGDEAVLYRASPWYMGLEWYDFTMVEFIDKNDAVQTYPSLLLGFVEFPKGHALSIDKKCTN